MTQPIPVGFPDRVKHAGTDPIHAARPIRAGGHNTACLIWLDPKSPHQWLPDTETVTCSRCTRRTAEEYQ